MGGLFGSIFRFDVVSFSEIESVLLATLGRDCYWICLGCCSCGDEMALVS